MALHAHINTGALIVALSLALAACGKQEQPTTPASEAKTQAPLTAADCDKLPDPKPRSESAAGRATAISEGVAARSACKRAVAAQADQNSPNADLARIREILEKQEAEREAQKVSEKEWGKNINQDSGKPFKQYKY